LLSCSRKNTGVAAARVAAEKRRPTLLAELRGRAILVLAAGAPNHEGNGVQALPQRIEERLRLEQVSRI